jgi:hypothetical protein
MALALYFQLTVGRQASNLAAFSATVEGGFI